jgi:hypothetical protein
MLWRGAICKSTTDAWVMIRTHVDMLEPKIRKGLELQTEPSSVYIDLSTISADGAFVLTDCIPFLHKRETHPIICPSCKSLYWDRPKEK